MHTLAGKAVIRCTWFDKNEIKSGVFPAETLELATKPKGGVRLIR
jgi:uncharacterized protein YodC (DUF2158 family)